MNTYMVEVNNKFLVRLEIEGSALAAEHYFLDGFENVWGAMAYDLEAMKTDCFIGAMLHDELITLPALEEKLNELSSIDKEMGSIALQIKAVKDEIENSNRKLEELQHTYDAALGRWFNQREELNAKRPY